MIAFLITAALLAATLHIAAHLNRGRNVAAGFTLGERSTLIGSALILGGYGVFLLLNTFLFPAPLPAVGAFAALAGCYFAAWVGAKSAWLLLDARDRDLRAELAALPRRWRQGGAGHGR